MPALCLSKSRYKDRALHFEARNPRVSPRRAPDDALEIADIGSNSPHHRRVQQTGVRPAVAVICAERRLRRDAVVAVVQTADFWKGDNAAGGRRCDQARGRRVLAISSVLRPTGLLCSRC